MKRAKISLYTIAEEVAATAYYRLFQYFDNFDNNEYRITKRAVLSNTLYRKWMPISQKPLYFKALAFFHMYFKRLSHLFADCIDTPDILIVSRCLIRRAMPLSYRLMLKYIVSKGSKLIWDYDDNIIDCKEISRKHFDWMSSLASRIVVAGEPNLKMLHTEHHHKALILPTTDGDMYKFFNQELTRDRLETLKTETRLIWVGTSISLPYVEAICPAIEKFARTTAAAKTVSLTVVCNHPLEYHPSGFRLYNIPWSRDVAIEEMKKAHFGIMPLSDKLFNWYKGGFKLIQYLSIGLPVVGSAIGINKEIIQSSHGFKPSALDCDQWLEALNRLPSDPEKYTESSRKAFSHWTDMFSYESNRKKWSDLVIEVLR